jgi:Tfp pilus assembly protein PilF
MKRFLAAGLLLGAGLVLAPAAGAQSSGAVRGKVVDEKGQPVVEAQVALEYLGGVTRKYQTKTNKKGEYTQVGLQPGMYRMTFTKEGYQGSTAESRVGLGEATMIPDMKIVSAAAAKAGGSAEAAAANAEIKAIVTRGEALVKEGKYDEAIAAFTELQGKPVAAPEEVQYRIATLHSAKKDWPAAEAAFLKVLEMKPDHAGARAELANVYQISGQAEKAQAMLAQISAAGGQDANVLYSTGIVHLNAGRAAEAAAAFKKAVEIDPKLADAYFHLATSLLNQGDTPGTIENLEKYLALSPTNAQNVATAQGLLKALKPAK